MQNLKSISFARKPHSILGATHTTRRTPITCSLETKHYFARRLYERGWPISPLIEPITPPHPLVKEAWAAMDTIYGAVGILETPIEHSEWLLESSRNIPASVHLKLENKQQTGSFKARGAAHKLLSLTPEERSTGIVTSSTGNHALAVLHAVQQLKEASKEVNATIYFPNTLSSAKRQKLETAAAAAGATLITHGTDCVEAEQEARSVAERSGKVYISPYNDTQVAGGQGTIAVELLMQLPRGKLDTVFVPVGGGGLISGIAAMLKHAEPGIKVIGCQPAKSDVMRRSVQQGKVVQLEWEETLSDGTAGGIEEGCMTLETCSQFVDEWVTVGEEEIAAAVVGMSKHHGMDVEGAAAVAVAAFLKKAEDMKGQHCVVVCCGGNVSPDLLEKAYTMLGISTTSKSLVR